MAMEKANPWAKESKKHEREFESIRDYKFKDDHKHHVRILPTKDEDKAPFFGYIIHWVPQQNSVKGRPVIHAIDKKCILCEAVSEIWTEINRLKEEEQMTDKSPEVAKLYKKQQEIKAAKKYDMNILDREDMYVKDEKGNKVVGPKRLVANKTIWQSVFEYAKNPKWGNPSDEKTGYDFEIVTEGEGDRRNYEVMPDRDASQLTDEEIDSMKRVYDLERLRKFTSLKDMREIIENAKAPHNELVDRLGVSDDDDDEKPTPKKEVKKSKPVEDDDDDDVVVEKVEEKPKSKAKPVEDDDDDEVVVEKVEEKAAVAGEDDLDQYECKGEVDESDEACVECPVKSDCKEFQPLYKKAKELKLDVSAKRSSVEIMEEVKALDKPADGDKVVKRKRLPF